MNDDILDHIRRKAMLLKGGWIFDNGGSSDFDQVLRTLPLEDMSGTNAEDVLEVFQEFFGEGHPYTVKIQEVFSDCCGS